MRAAVVHAPNAAPRYEEFAEPDVVGDEVVAKLLAAGLHPLVRVHAGGSHYSSRGTYPLIPGVDGVAELPDGRRVYMGWLRPPFGTFAERVAVPPGRVLEIPGVAPELVAGIMNPASSSWLALRLRARLVAGETVLVMGATGSAGRLAVQIARSLGAGRVIAAGRNRAVLETLAADAIIPLPDTDQLEREFVSGIDIVLDYLWGAPAEQVMAAIVKARSSRRIRFVNIGEAAGEAVISPHALRSANLEMLGSGLGSVAPFDMVREMPALMRHVPKLTLDIEVVPLARVETAWHSGGDRRIVITP